MNILSHYEGLRNQRSKKDSAVDNVSTLFTNIDLEMLCNREQPLVAILLCTYQGERYLAPQLDSFATQTYSNWKVWVSDDGSHDGTHTILNDYKTRWSSDRLTIHTGPKVGFAANFLSLTCRPSITADYFAYADQDDVWESDKLQRAIKWLDTIPSDTPALYCSRTRLVDDENRHIGFSPLFTKPPSFANALMQNIGGGNTMVFNQATRDLLCIIGADVPVVTHDWLVYMVVMGCGGRVFYDNYPSLRYRQHNDNVIGMNSSWKARLIRLNMLMKGDFRRWNDENIKALNRISDFLTDENRACLDRFVKARDEIMPRRLISLKRSGVYRQTRLGNLGLIAAAIFKKI